MPSACLCTAQESPSQTCRTERFAVWSCMRHFSSWSLAVRVKIYFESFATGSRPLYLETLKSFGFGEDSGCDSGHLL
jgi:hypothetical protein